MGAMRTNESPFVQTRIFVKFREEAIGARTLHRVRMWRYREQADRIGPATSVARVSTL
jgi:hypothetical protein